MKYLIVLALYFVFIVNCDDTNSQTTSAIRSDLKQCDVADPGYDECMKENMQKLIQTEKGFDPLIIENMTISINEPLVQGKIKIKHARATGVSAAKIKSIHLKQTQSKTIANIHILIPRLFVEGDFKGHLRVSNRTIKPKGNLNVTMINLDAKVQLIGKTIRQDGKEYRSYDAMNIDPTLKDFKMNAKGLVEDPSLNDLIVEMINSEWRTNYKQFLNESKKAWSPVVLAQINAIMKEIPV